jgi:nicotinamidase-related amidase
VVVVGLALDFCVGSTALDAQEAGFETSIVREATKAALSHMAEVMLGRL